MYTIKVQYAYYCYMYSITKGSHEAQLPIGPDVFPEAKFSELFVNEAHV